MEVTIVPMRQEHTAQIAALEAACFSDPWPESILQKELENPLSLWLCAMDGDTVAGYVGSQTVLGEADMMNLAVSPAYRRQGLGRALVLALCESLRQKMQATVLTLEVRDSNAPAAALYASLGMEGVLTETRRYNEALKTLGINVNFAPVCDVSTNPDNFISLLYYFGMLTISGTYKGKARLTIPNMVVQEQLYTYLLNTYDDADLSFSSYEKSELSSALAYDGDWQSYFGYIADCLHRYASQRDKQKGESFVHGFTLAMTAQNRFYRPVSEQDTQEGYVDIFLCPMLEIYSDMKHSYIVELKYAKYKDSETRVEELRREAIAQADRYADTETVKRGIGATRLHKIVVVYKGMEMRICEEVG